MKKRWIIRSIFIGLLTFCVVAWAGSYWLGADVIHVRADSGWEEWLSMCDGKLGLGAIPSGALQKLGWHLSLWFGSDLHWAAVVREQHYGLTTYHGAGFGFQPGEHWQIHVPFWFPTFLTALLLVFVWRKTRAKPEGQAFPVEPAKSGEKQA